MKSCMHLLTSCHQAVQFGICQRAVMLCGQNVGVVKSRLGFKTQKLKTETKTLMLNSQNQDKGQGQIKRGIALA